MLDSWLTAFGILMKADPHKNTSKAIWERIFASVSQAVLTFLSQILLLQLISLNCLQKSKRKGALGNSCRSWGGGCRRAGHFSCWCGKGLEQSWWHASHSLHGHLGGGRWCHWLPPPPPTVNHQYIFLRCPSSWLCFLLSIPRRGIEFGRGPIKLHGLKAIV